MLLVNQVHLMEQSCRPGCLKRVAPAVTRRCDEISKMYELYIVKYQLLFVNSLLSFQIYCFIVLHTLKHICTVFMESALYMFALLAPTVGALLKCILIQTNTFC